MNIRRFFPVISSHHPSAACHILRNQRGTALVLALIMLTIMSLLGALALSSSTTEIGISSNYRSSQQAFYAAERAVEYAMTASTIYDTIGTGTVDLSDNDKDNETTHEANIRAGTSGATRARLREEPGDVNQVKFLTSGALPPGSGSDPTYFQARYYIIQATGEGPNNSAARVEVQVARIVPK